MAFINKETVKNIRNALKKEFPEVKFSVRMEDYSSVHVVIVKSPYFEEEHTGVNHRWIDSSNYPDATKKFVNRVDEIIRTTGEYYNNSDSMTDYFDVAFYYDIEVGKWNKPHTNTAN